MVGVGRDISTCRGSLFPVSEDALVAGCNVLMHYSVGPQPRDAHCRDPGELWGQEWLKTVRKRVHGVHQVVE